MRLAINVPAGFCIERTGFSVAPLYALLCEARSNEDFFRRRFWNFKQNVLRIGRFRAEVCVTVWTLLTKDCQMVEPVTDVVESPTNVRWLTFSLACGTSWFLYLHRYSWNIVAPTIQEEYHFDHKQSGTVFSLFYWTYAAGQIPSGVIIDLFGSHLFIGTCIILWSLTLIGFGQTKSLWLIGLLRLQFGAFQAGCYPGLTKATHVWFPHSSRTTVQGWVATTFGRGGGAMSPILLGSVLMGYFGLKWQTALAVFGVTGVGFGVLFLLLFRNSPQSDSRVNDAERRLIAEGAPIDSATSGRVLAWSHAIQNRSLRFFAVQQFLDAGSDVAFVYLIGNFFFSRYGLKISSVGWMSSLPLWGGALGGIVGGWLNDRIIRTTGNRRWSRSGIGFIGKVIGCAMLYVVAEQAESVAAFIEPVSQRFRGIVSLPPSAALGAGIALMLAKFFSDWSQPTVWGTCTDLGGRFSATVFSIINTAGTIGGIVMPIIFGTLLDWSTTRRIVEGLEIAETNWGPLFLLLAAMYLASGIFWLLIDCTNSLATD